MYNVRYVSFVIFLLLWLFLFFGRLEQILKDDLYDFTYVWAVAITLATCRNDPSYDYVCAAKLKPVDTINVF